MKKYLSLLICCAVVLSACGGGGKSTTSAPMVIPPPIQQPQQPVEPPTQPQQPVQAPQQPQQPVEPPVQSQPTITVPEAFPNKIGDVGSMEVAFERHGSYADLEKYFKDIVRYACAFAGRCIGDIVDRFDGAPIVKISGYATDEQKQKVQNAIQVVNQVLPDGHKMIFSSEIAPRARLAYTTVPEGEIHVGFDDPKYHAKLRETSTYVRYHLSNGSYGGAHIWTSSGNGFIPAFLRALGLRGSVSSVPSIFNPATHRGNVSIPKPYTSLTTLDKQALKALYSHFDNGDNMLSDGPWNSSDFDFEARLTWGCFGQYCGGAVDDLHFGVTYGNGSGRPWVNGPTPNTDVSRNSSLVPDPSLGEVRYEGGIVGVDSEQNLVFGDTIFDLDLDTLKAVVLFHNLRVRNVHNTNDFNIDRGRPWKRRHIGGYRVQITGNSFENTSKGIVGSFFGPSHEYVGGTLQRSDLTAAFGAKRPR